jgi:hypothetical protein
VNFEGRRQSRFVKRRRGILLNSGVEGVRIVAHPREQRRSGLIRIGARGLPGFDPAADEIMGELPEAAIRAVEFIGLRMASRKEGFL